MKNKTKCKLIEDLLTLYIDNLVSEESKIEIEKHLKECNKCSEELENIKKENGLVLEEEFTDNNEKEIKCVKNIKRRIKIRILIAIIISILATAIWIKLYDTYRIIKNEDDKYILYNTNTGNIQKGKNGINIIAKYNQKYMGRDIEYYVVYTFDKNDKCINCRKIISGYKEKDMYEFKSNYEDSLHTYNIEIKENKLYFNDNLFIGKSKDNILKYLKECNAEIEEI